MVGGTDLALSIIEGSWEEIKRHEAELAGQWLRVTVTNRKPDVGKSNVPKNIEAASPRRVSALGKYAGILSSEDFVRQKQAEIDLEDRVRE
jgi:hypothetical protein